MLLAPLNQTSGLQGLCDGSWSDLAGNDLGIGSGWKQSKQNQTPLCSDGTRGRSTLNHLIAALATQLHLCIAAFYVEPSGGEWQCVTYCRSPPARLHARPPAGRATARPPPRKHDGRSPAVPRRLPAVTRAFDAVWPLLTLNATS